MCYLILLLSLFQFKLSFIDSNKSFFTFLEPLEFYLSVFCCHKADGSVERGQKAAVSAAGYVVFVLMGHLYARLDKMVAIVSLQETETSLSQSFLFHEQFTLAQSRRLPCSSRGAFCLLITSILFSVFSRNSVSEQ